MTRASFFAALLAPFLAALPKRRGTLKSLVRYGDGLDQDVFERARRRFDEARASEIKMRQEMLKDLSSLDGKTAAASEEGIEVLSSWVDPTSGDTIALVLLKKNFQKEETSSRLLT